MSGKKVHTGLLDFDRFDLSAASSAVLALARSKTPAYVVTPNADHLARLVATKDEELLNIYRNADIILCDSRIVQKLIWFAVGQDCPVVPGSDLTGHLFENCVGKDDTLLIIGGQDKVITNLRERFPTLTINHINPSMGFINEADEVSELLDFACAVDPDMLFLAVGSPQQERLAETFKRAGVRGVSLCIGASILFLVDAEKRAPLWMQKAHLEWFYRMIQNPKKLVARYGSNAVHLSAIYRGLKKI